MAVGTKLRRGRITRTLVAALVGAAGTLGAYGAVAGHMEGVETNVAMVACLIDKDAPHRIDVVASSVNATKNQIPIISRDHSCAETLHELMTAGFKIEQANLERLTFVFVLTRQDASPEKH